MTGERATIPGMTDAEEARGGPPVLAGQTGAMTAWQMRVAERLARSGRSLADVPAVPAGTTAEDVAERLRLQAENRAARWRKRLPVMYRNALLADLDPEQHASTVRGWLDSDSPTLVLAGTIGSGKTHAAYAVGNAAIARGLHVEAVRVHDLLEALRPDGDRDVTWSAQHAAVLVLDDLGAGRSSPFAQDELTALLDLRLNHGLRQVVTTNQTALVLEEALGGRFVDRLRYRATVCAFAGQSRRSGW